jgi:acylphosphatase
MAAREHLFDVYVHFTATVEYGFTLAQVVEGAPIPEGGARFDVYFEGEVSGPRLTGKVTGVDYVVLREDRTTTLHIHGHITTQDGAHIAFQAEGTTRRPMGALVADIEEQLSFSTAAESYRWLNRVTAVGSGTTDTVEGWVKLRVTHDVAE